MSMKKILMAAVAVSALTAGSASALAINVSSDASVAAGGTQAVGGSKVGLQFLAPTAGQIALGGKSDAFTVASEAQLTAASAVAADIRLSTKEPLPASGRYVVTFKITGGTFVNTGVVSTDLTTQTAVANLRTTATYLDAYYASLFAANPVTATNSTSAANRLLLDAGLLAASAANQATWGPAAVLAGNTALTALSAATLAGYNGAVVTTGTVSPTAVSFLFQAGSFPTTGITWLSKGIIPGADKGPVGITAEVSTEANQALLIDGGATTSVNVIDFRTALAFKATAADQTLSIASGFKKFGTAAATAAADTTSAAVGTSVGFALAGPAITGDVGDAVYKLNGDAVTTADVTAASLTIGGSLAAFDARIGTSTTAQLADATTGVTGALNPTNLALLVAKNATIRLQQKATPVAGNEATYTVKPTDVSLTSGLIAGTFSAKTIGKVSFEGVNFYGAWLTDGAGTSGFKNIIRLGNKSAADIASVKVSLVNPLKTGTSGTVASTATCEVGTLKATSELLITSETLYKCFGAFSRSDVRITIQGDKADLSAKLRLVSPDGSATDTNLGSGTADATDTYYVAPAV